MAAEPTECGYGYHYDEGKGGCVPDDDTGSPTPTPTGSPNCNPGTHVEYPVWAPNGTCVQDGKSTTPNQGEGTGNTGSPVPAAPNVPRIPVNYNPSQANYNFYAQRTPEEIQFMQALTGLANLQAGAGSSLYQAGMPAYEQALNYWRAILSGNRGAQQRAVAPQAESIGQTYTGAERSLAANPALARSGARGYATAELAREKAGAIASLIPKATEGAAQAAANYGLSGVQAGIQGLGAAAGTFGSLLGSEQSNRNTAAQLEQANRFGATQLDIQSLMNQMSTTLGFRAQDIQQMLGLAGIDLGYYQADASNTLAQQQLAFQQQQAAWNQSFQEQYFNWYQQNQAAQLQQQQQQAKGNKWGSLLGTLLNFGGNVIPGLGGAGR